MATDANIQLDSEFTYQQYSPPLIPQVTNVAGTTVGGAVTTINGDAGAGASGPVVVFSANDGFSFIAVGASVTLSLTSAATLLAALGLSKNNSALVPPTIANDSSQGYSVNSLWTDTALDNGFMCVDASVGAAIWKQVTP